jgi:hypothetical protein
MLSIYDAACNIPEAHAQTCPPTDVRHGTPQRFVATFDEFLQFLAVQVRKGKNRAARCHITPLFDSNKVLPT